MNKQSQDKGVNDFRDWVVDAKAHQFAQASLAADGIGVPNNPDNVKSFIGMPNAVDEKKSLKEGVENSNPYGDATRMLPSEVPVWTKPTQKGAYFDAPPVPVEPTLAISKFGGNSKGKTKAKGMSTGVGLMGSGPQRNVTAPAGPGM